MQIHRQTNLSYRTDIVQQRADRQKTAGLPEFTSVDDIRNACHLTIYHEIAGLPLLPMYARNKWPETKDYSKQTAGVIIRVRQRQSELQEISKLRMQCQEKPREQESRVFHAGEVTVRFTRSRAPLHRRRVGDLPLGRLRESPTFPNRPHTALMASPDKEVPFLSSRLGHMALLNVSRF